MVTKVAREMVDAEDSPLWRVVPVDRRDEWMGVVETRRPQKTASAYFGEARKRGGIQGVREVAHGGGSLDRGKMAGG